MLPLRPISVVHYTITVKVQGEIKVGTVDLELVIGQVISDITH